MMLWKLGSCCVDSLLCYVIVTPEKNVNIGNVMA